MLVSKNASARKWARLPFQKPVVTIGRAPNCDVVVPEVSVSRLHAKITQTEKGWVLSDERSANGVYLNEHLLGGRCVLHDRDVITIGHSRFVYTSGALYYTTTPHGVSVECRGIVVRRGKGRKSFITSDHVNLCVEPGELVAIVGGSGAGKSTLLNVMCGYLHPTAGKVTINGMNLYRHMDTMKKTFGYVPQNDIVYNNLTLYDMLDYSAKLRLSRDVSPRERARTIKNAIEMVSLQGKENSLIKSLSGGQRKRASIAVELLSSPNLLFLDEPASGLDPGTERQLMQVLRQMADAGKTIILVTHSTLQLAMCDKVAFMGKGGKLCFYGQADEAKQFFQVESVVDIYNKLNEQSAHYQKLFQTVYPQTTGEHRKAQPLPAKKHRPRAGLGVLCARYSKLIFNDGQRLTLLLAQVPLLVILIALVANGQQFIQYERTKALLFALSCASFWVGMLNAIQEICKELPILKREFMTGLSLSMYLLSKVLVLGVFCLIQSLGMAAMFALTVGLPEEGVFMHPFWEMSITTWLTALSATAMGLLASSMFSNPDRAMSIAPLLLMPQMLFSGLLFKLSGATEVISLFAICRWSMEGFGTIANLNSLELLMQQEGNPNIVQYIVHEAEDFFNLSTGHLIGTWLLLLLFTVGFAALARLSLNKMKKDAG